MDRKNFLLYSSAIIAFLIICAYSIFIFQRNYSIQKELSIAEIMETIKTDKDYADLLTFINGFNPEITNYIKLGRNEYDEIKPDWGKQGFGDRIKIIDEINLNNFTYWIELKNKNDETKGLQTIIDVQKNKSLLLIATLSIKASVGL